MVVGMFMAILDIQIVASSIGTIQAGLSASTEEISWIQTSYLIAEVIMIPLSGWLSRLLSTRYLFVLSAAGFTLMSLVCATATSIEQMIVYRALQGFIGGAMIPTVFSAAYGNVFPPGKRTSVSVMIGLIVTLAPTIGPTLGGYLTDALSWHWLFLINIVPGIIVSIAVWLLIDIDEPDFSLLGKIDLAGIGLMAV
ncbi:MAG: MFS transporter, partial [Parvibaculum sp.]|nr:MFS transporter [Parvibaculum sp.]